MRILMTLALSGLLAMPAFADHEHDHADAETITRIEAMLADMECQMDPDDIEKSEDGYELDDVICKGGSQFDIDLDNDLNVVEKREE